ncbi:DUF1064 domain-containing protein [Muribaculum intestinale]|nr:DUF1064 domain-containing protein [Muribaculum intestinale]
MTERMTIEELRKHSREITSRSYGSGTSKYHAERVGGHASKKEHNRANQLKLMQRAGVISGLREQVSYVVIPAQRDGAGKLLEHACRYIADFVYYDKNGELVVEDTKGFKTPEYKIKRKLMLLVHGIRIKET